MARVWPLCGPVFVMDPLTPVVIVTLVTLVLLCSVSWVIWPTSTDCVVGFVCVLLCGSISALPHVVCRTYFCSSLWFSFVCFLWTLVSQVPTSTGCVERTYCCWALLAWMVRCGLLVFWFVQWPYLLQDMAFVQIG